MRKKDFGNIPGQLEISDCLMAIEPDVGSWIYEAGANISHIMLQGYVGEKVCFDCHTQSIPSLFKVGILESYKYFELDQCWVATICYGRNKRAYIKKYKSGWGGEVYECLPWDKYPRRMAAIGRH